MLQGRVFTGSQSGLKGIRLLVCIFTLLVCFGHSDAHASATVNELKAVFLFNFLDFMQWPDDPFEAQRNQANICIIGNGALADNLRHIGEKKKARGVYSLHVLSVDRLSMLSKLEGCNVVYLDHQRQQDSSSLVGKTRGKSILTVSDIKGFASSGGAVEFTYKRNKVGLRINRSILRLAKLSVNPHLLALAEVIYSEEREMPFRIVEEEKIPV